MRACVRAHTHAFHHQSFMAAVNREDEEEEKEKEGKDLATAEEGQLGGDTVDR